MPVRSHLQSSGGRHPRATRRHAHRPRRQRVQIEVFRAGELDEVRVLVEVGDASAAPRLQEALRASLGIRLEVAPVPLRSLPRYELKARRVVRR
ncbi:MAG: hypothetical protein DMD99_18810 [Candidatus Rokuibacteriota bacterium]|nr:MAG: hypothetical protein DMD99_18810 [Candidatus Rokubacteria bacterium]